MVLHDWQRGRIPYFVAPPRWEDTEAGKNGGAPMAPKGLRVEQRFNSIPVLANFDKEDLRGEPGFGEEMR